MRLWVCLWCLPTQQQLKETLRKLPLIVTYHTTDNKYLISVASASFTVSSFGQQMVDRTAITRTLQYAADIASSCNGQQMSAKALQHRWKHEIQIALLRRRAAMTRAVLTNPSARAECRLAGITARAVSHWVQAPPLDGGDGENNADTGTDTAIPDASLTSQQILSWAACPLLSTVAAWSLKLSSKIWRCSGVIADFLALQQAIYEPCALVQPLPSALQLATDEGVLVSCLTLLSFVTSHLTPLGLLYNSSTLTVTSTSSSWATSLPWLPLSACSFFDKSSTVAGVTPHASRMLIAVTKLLTRHQFNDVPALHTARTIQQVTRADFHCLEILEFELSSLTPAAWIEIFSRRL